MEAPRDLSSPSRDALAHYRRRSPGGEQARDNWAAIERKLAAGVQVDEGDVGRDLAGWPEADSRLDESDDGLDDFDDLRTFEDLDDLDGMPANDRRSNLGRVLMSIGTSVAIAAAVLLLLRGVFVGATALSEDARALPSQAVDAESHGDDARTWEGRTPARTTAGGTAKQAPAPAAEPVADTAPAPVVPVAEPAAPAATPKPIATPKPSPDPAPTLAEETKALGQARNALAAARYADAAELAREYQRRFPDGAFLEELHAIHAIASCKQGVAGDPLAAFLARHPKSPLLSRVQSGCKVAQ